MSTQYQVQTDSNSAEMQRSACMRITEDKGLTVKKVIEQVKSGRKYRKDLFDVIHNEMRAGDCIIVYSISRFARKQLHAHQLLDIIKRKRCRLISLAENIDTAVDESIIGLFAWLAEMESKQTSDRVKSSIKSKKDRLEHVGAMPYGYQYSAGKGSPLEVNTAEMEVLQKMRHWYNEEKKSFSWIAGQLNTDGVPMAKRKDRTGGWTSNTVKKLVIRDDSQILMKGKRSWYLAQEQIKLQQEALEMTSSSSDSGSSSDDSDEEPNVSTVENKIDWSSKNDILLRAMLMKRKQEFGLNDDAIKSLDRESMIMLLS